MVFQYSVFVYTFTFTKWALYFCRFFWLPFNQIISIWRAPFSISCKVRPMVRTLPAFVYLGNFEISPSFLKDNFGRHSILGWQFPSFSNSNISLHSCEVREPPTSRPLTHPQFQVCFAHKMIVSGSRDEILDIFGGRYVACRKLCTWSTFLDTQIFLHEVFFKQSEEGHLLEGHSFQNVKLSKHLNFDIPDIIWLVWIPPSLKSTCNVWT